MERELILRNVVCVAAVNPSAFGVEAFAERLELGTPEDQLIVGDVALSEWRLARLQVRPDRLQLGFKKDAESDFVRAAVADFLGRADELAPGNPIDFNAGLFLTIAEGGEDPSLGIVDADGLANSLGAKSGGRGGITLVYNDSRSRWWVELSPQPAQDRRWSFDFNRHFPNFPDPGEDRDAVLDWFADVENYLLTQFETISRGADR